MPAYKMLLLLARDDDVVDVGSDSAREVDNRVIAWVTGSETC